MNGFLPLNILKQELKSNLKSLIIWCLTMVFLIYAGMMKYGAFEKTGQAVNEVFEKMPAPMLKIMGMGDGLDLTSIAVFYSIFFLYFILLAAVHSTMLGTLIIAKEERDHTADFLLVKPIKRHQAISAKVVCALINVLILNGVTYLVSIAATAPYQTKGLLTREIGYIALGLLLIQVVFLGLGLLLGGALARSKAATGTGTAIILATFTLKVLIDLKADLDFLDFLTPFRYFSAQDLMFDGRLDMGFALLALCLASIGTAGSYWFYGKRDIRP